MPALSDYLLLTSLTARSGFYVRVVNNATAVAYVSDGVTDTNGKFTFSVSLPIPGTYTVYTGPSAAGPWTATGDANYLVPVTAGDDVALKSLTILPSSPYNASARPGSVGALIFDTGGAVVNLQGAKYTALGTWDPSAGTGNASQATQQFLTDSAGKVAFAPPGTYMIGPFNQTGASTQVCLGIPDNTTLLGAGAATIFKFIANASNGFNLWAIMGTNNFNAGAGRINKNCSIQHVVFDGNLSNQTLSAGIAHSGVVFWPVTNHYLEDVTVQNIAHATGIEGFGFLMNGDTAGNDTTVTRVNGVMNACRASNTGTGIGIHGLLGEQLIGCQAGQDTTFMGFTLWAGTGLRSRDIEIVGCFADTCQVGFELEACMGVKVTGSTARNCQAAGIRLTASSTGTPAIRNIIVGNEIYNNNTSNTAGFAGGGIVFQRNAGADPTDNIVTGNRCYDELGAAGTQLYGISQDPAMAVGSQNNVWGNNCRGNKTANTLGIQSPYQNATQGANMNLAVAAATPTGMTTTFTLDTDSTLVMTTQGVVAWDAGTANGNLNDVVQMDLRVDGAIKISNFIKCGVAAVGEYTISVCYAQTLAAGSHTIDAQVANQTGARGLFGKGNIAIQVLPNQQ